MPFSLLSPFIIKLFYFLFEYTISILTRASLLALAKSIYHKMWLYQLDYISLHIKYLFGRGPNRVMETACFDANVQ